MVRASGSQRPNPVHDLPEPLAPVDVPQFLEPYGYFASSHLLWRAHQPPELTLQVTSHCTIGKHTYYHLDCTLAKATGSSEDKYSWQAARRLAHLREGLHDPLKRSLGSSYQTYFCGVHFARHLRPAGTTARLDTWCRRLAYCITSKLAPPEIAAAMLRVLGAPILVPLDDCCGNICDGNITQAQMSPAEHAGVAAAFASMSGLPGSCGIAGVGSVTGLFDTSDEGANDGDMASIDPDKDTLASEGASASTADPFFGNLAASLSACRAASSGGTSNCSSEADACGDSTDGQIWDNDTLPDAVFQKAEDPASSDPYGGRRRPWASQ